MVGEISQSLRSFEMTVKSGLAMMLVKLAHMGHSPFQSRLVGGVSTGSTYQLCPSMPQIIEKMLTYDEINQRLAELNESVEAVAKEI